MYIHTPNTLLFFFFQAEDGIRDLTVTGVQTCALPILHWYWLDHPSTKSARLLRDGKAIATAADISSFGADDASVAWAASDRNGWSIWEIGRAACRGRV